MGFGKKKKAFGKADVIEAMPMEYKRPMSIRIEKAKNGFSVNYCNDKEDGVHVFSDSESMIEQLKKWVS